MNEKLVSWILGWGYDHCYIEKIIVCINYLIFLVLSINSIRISEYIWPREKKKRMKENTCYCHNVVKSSHDIYIHNLYMVILSKVSHEIFITFYIFIPNNFLLSLNLLYCLYVKLTTYLYYSDNIVRSSYNQIYIVTKNEFFLVDNTFIFHLNNLYIWHV